MHISKEVNPVLSHVKFTRISRLEYSLVCIGGNFKIPLQLEIILPLVTGYGKFQYQTIGVLRRKSAISLNELFQFITLSLCLENKLMQIKIKRCFAHETQPSRDEWLF